MPLPLPHDPLPPFHVADRQPLGQTIWLKAIVTGENLGQVASQTLDNMSVIENASDMLVLRPLLTFEKLETVAIAEKIGTFNISAQNIPDSCTVFAPDDPATSARLDFILFE